MNNHITNLENKELVVNWHITEACNFKCTYCFAKWDKNGKELLHSAPKVENLLDELLKLPNILNQKYATKFTGLRLNLVGGETFLYKAKVLNIIHKAKKRGFSLSAITNASKLDDEFLKEIATNFSSIGFSVDSIDSVTNLKIGRAYKGLAMSIVKMMADIEHLRYLNPNLDIKINTVVSSLNHTENLSQLIEIAKPSKWKIFKVLPSTTDEYMISNNEFLGFLARHGIYNDIIFSEDNDEMTDSYLMVDPLGRFFQNSNRGNGYIYSDAILNLGVEVALNQVNFDIDKFLGRYRQKIIPLLNVV